MVADFRGKERREFLRFDYNEPVRYRLIKMKKDTTISSGLMDAISKNLSASGILFVTNVGKEPEVSSLVILDLDFKTTNVCQEIEERALVVDNKLVGKVVRIEDNDDGTCGVGVAFVKKTDSLAAQLRGIEKRPNRR